MLFEHGIIIMYTQLRFLPRVQVAYHFGALMCFNNYISKQQSQNKQLPHAL